MIEFESEPFVGGASFADWLIDTTIERATVAVHEATMHLRTKTVERLAGTRSGSTYFVPGAMHATYTASRPGEAPASATGKLRQAVDVRAPVVDGNEVVGEVGVDGRRVPYARRMEYGGLHVQPRDVRVRTPTGWITVRAGTVIYIAPRPYLRPTFDGEADTVRRMIERRIETG